MSQICLHNPSLVLVQPRKTRPCLTERLLKGSKESNQTNMSLTLLAKIKFLRKYLNLQFSCHFRIEPLNEFYDGDKDNDKENDGYLEV